MKIGIHGLPLLGRPARGLPMGGPSFVSPGVSLPNLAAWWRSDLGVMARTAALFTRANSESLSIADAAQTGLDMGTGDFSLAGWIRLTAGVPTNGFYGVSGKRTSTGIGYSVDIRDVTDVETLRLVIADAGGTTIVSGGNNPFSVNTWYHIAATFDRDGDGSLYINAAVNGTPASIASRNGDIGNAVAFRLGAYDDPTHYLDGRMSCWGIWTKVLSGGEITTLYNSGVALRGSELTGSLLTNLASYWDLTEESGTRAATAGSANTLTDNNTVTAADGPTAPYSVSADGSVVARWVEQKTGSLLPDQSDHTKKPLLKTNITGGQAVVRFDGTDDFLKIASGAVANQPLSIWMVLKDNDAGTRFYVDGGAASKAAILNDDTNVIARAGADLTDPKPSSAFRTYQVDFNGASSEIFYGNVSQATGDAGAQNQDSGIAFGADNAGASPLAGDIAEVVVNTGLLTSVQRAQLEAYAVARYGL